MAYTNVIVSGRLLESYEYEKVPAQRAYIAPRTMEGTTGLSDISFGGEVAGGTEKREKTRSAQSTRRAVLSFSRLVRSNLGGAEYPFLGSFTYAQNQTEIGVARKDWNRFSRLGSAEFGNGFRSICVAEFQQRGAVHFHSLLWGIPPGVFATERSNRTIARMWGRGFCDIVKTDGSEKLSSYLSKYFVKSFSDPRLFGRKAYIATRNVLKPRVFKDTLLAPFFYGQIEGADLSTALLLRSSEYETQWLGRAIYKRYSLETDYGKSPN